MRIDGRKNDELRNIRITRNYTIYAEGSVLIEMGNTKVICTATIDESVPAFLKGTGKGWVTAEYSMLPRATQTRTSRDIQKLRQNARSVEIQRLIGRALRMAVDLEALGERSVVIDCDVIQADGGTRTASISGGFVALYDAVRKLDKVTPFNKFPIVKNIAAVSVGIVNNNEILDLCYEEDSKAEVDMNAVMDENGNFVELQGTGENGTFSPVQLNRLVELAVLGGKRIIEAQRLSIDTDTEL